MSSGITGPDGVHHTVRALVTGTWQEHTESVPVMIVLEVLSNKLVDHDVLIRQSRSCILLRSMQGCVNIIRMNRCP